MSQIALTVVIPTFNRKEKLAQCVSSLMERSDRKRDFEIIIVDDGSTDGTDELVRRMSKDRAGRVRYFRQEKKGPASARNIGIRNALGRIILFMGDDIIASEALVAGHLEWHDRFPEENVGVLGFITWSDRVRITPFMAWLETSGVQFDYRKLEGKTEAPAEYFYSSNISLKKNFLISNGGYFDEAFPYAAYEDIELGLRLKKAGLALRYNQSAVGYHYHYTSLYSACRRMVTVGKSTVIFWEKTGQWGQYRPKGPWRSFFSAAKFLMFYIAALYCEKRVINEHVYKNVMAYCTYLGVGRMIGSRPKNNMRKR